MTVINAKYMCLLAFMVAALTLHVPEAFWMMGVTFVPYGYLTYRQLYPGED